MKKFFFLSLSSLLFLVGVGCTRTVATPQTPSETPAAPRIVTSEVKAESQGPKTYVNVAMVNLGVAGAVVVYDAAGGAPGEVIGQSQVFKPGVYTVTVQLRRPSKAGEILYAALRGENGALLKNVLGADAISEFRITE